MENASRMNALLPGPRPRKDGRQAGCRHAGQAIADRGRSMIAAEGRKATVERPFDARIDPLRSSEFPSLEDGHEENSDGERGPHRARLDPGPGPTIDKD